MSTNENKVKTDECQLSFPGFYSRGFTEREKRDLVSQLGEGMQDEIKLLKAYMRRNWERAEEIADLAESRRMMLAMGQMSIYILRLKKAQREMGADGGDLDDLYIQKIDEMAKEINRP
ncbi:MAG: hypothetical protein PVG14_19985 [Anaerolineales bacterium]|jgi:hypothetical protein